MISVISEVGGPAPLLFVRLLEVGFLAGAVAPTLVVAVTMTAIPYAVMLWLTKAAWSPGLPCAYVWPVRTSGET